MGSQAAPQERKKQTQRRRSAAKPKGEQPASKAEEAAGNARPNLPTEFWTLNRELGRTQEEGLQLLERAGGAFEEGIARLRKETEEEHEPNAD